jgi:hypothetical protein
MAPGISLITQNGHDWIARYPLMQAVNALRCSSCPIDGEAVWCGEDGVAVFDGLRRRGASDRVFLRAFDLLELNEAVPALAKKGVRPTTEKIARRGRRTAHCPGRPAGGTLVSTSGGWVSRGVVRSFIGWSWMLPGALGALALLPTVSAAWFIRLLPT